MSESTPLSEEIKHIQHIQNFMESHSNILINGNTRAIFAIGVCVGILMQVQEEKYNKTAPFWNRLNRLDMDLQRVIELMPDVKSKLAMYNERKHDTVINYLEAYEVSRIEKSSFISKDCLNLIFSIGLAYGYLLSRGYLK
jgi:CRISPR-associated protein Cas8b/Csh1 subtype I-B